ncbi:hypothetical protein THAOC_03101, partial [Thalassiosira oceanica]
QGSEGFQEATQPEEAARGARLASQAPLGSAKAQTDTSISQLRHSKGELKGIGRWPDTSGAAAHACATSHKLPSPPIHSCSNVCQPIA